MSDSTEFDALVLAALETRSEPCWPSDLMQSINESKVLRRPITTHEVRTALDRLERKRSATRLEMGTWEVK